MQKQQLSERITQCERVFRDRGLPMTIQRRAVFEELLCRNDHPTVDQIHQVVNGRLHGVSRTTVYRVLEALVEAGVAQKVCHPGASARYDANIHRHHHMVCLRCEKVVDLHSDDLDALPMPQTFADGFEMTDFTIHFRGVCADCKT